MSMQAESADTPLLQKLFRGKQELRNFEKAGCVVAFDLMQQCAGRYSFGGVSLLYTLDCTYAQLYL